ncbi:uncharacterized protein LAESUDRAFT_810707 [Laetiporus sulphureus 93-53]|uniref:Arrestin-like N-terminal domain-containing protein n=1 Tax=Laetiporus sulphureus 93-53 TaxID=1314785 RepID=A0A165G2I2_9APHY|nr:uncharacterized protein LAESUDRAFT_810707 [Laetiporus sulphureus 93-53]KZT09743.1 hypothetical protein LAESUDRAFT_810707 [Laetiporus sulphureus 93-53]
MALSIEIRPHSHSLDMFGRPDVSTAYSLSGDVALSLLCPYSIFERRRCARLLLQSLVIHFEGQCELITDETGYVPYRVYRDSKELIVGGPVELSNDGHEDTCEPCTWNVAFNLVVPGWLPTSCVVGDYTSVDSGTSYALYVTATFLDVDEETSTSWISSWFPPLCYPFRSRKCVVHAARCDIIVNRYTSQPAREPSSPALSSSHTVDYTVYADQNSNVDTSSGVPFEVVSKVRALISVPDYVDVNDTSFPLCLRLRTKDLPEHDCKRLRVTGFSLDIEQIEQYRNTPSAAYKSSYPLPPASEQPPHRPLRNPHPFHAVYEVGLGASPPSQNVYTRTVSLLPDNRSGGYMLEGDRYIFKRDAEPECSSTWFAIRTDVSFSGSSHKRPRRLQQSGRAPLYAFTHRLQVTLECTYDLNEGDEPECATEWLRFSIPLRFARVMRSCPSECRALTPSELSFISGRSPSPSVESLSNSSTFNLALVSSAPYAQSLPAYSQLFDEYGERKIDYSVPLPLYTPNVSPGDVKVEESFLLG